MNQNIYAATTIDALKSSTKLSIMTQAMITVLYLVMSASRLELIDNCRGKVPLLFTYK